MQPWICVVRSVPACPRLLVWVLSVQNMQNQHFAQFHFIRSTENMPDGMLLVSGKHPFGSTSEFGTVALRVRHFGFFFVVLMLAVTLETF